jgi:MHS family shikimate/dehydroshikimate transporter-like MFS transporter
MNLSDRDTTRARRVIVASVIGNVLEWYDFFLYGTAAALVFGELFFPIGKDPLTGTLASFAGFAVGFAARPLGAFLFGMIGDRVGRRVALVATLSIMGAATFLIGLLPTYAQVGFWAPALLVVLRLLQGVAAGGEWGGAVLLISENVSTEKRGRLSAFSQIGVTGGFVLSSTAFLLIQQLPREDLLNWGWRIPFLVSILIFAVGAYVRNRLPESDEFVRAKTRTHSDRLPISEAIRRYPRNFLVGMGLRIVESGASYIFLAFSLSYGKYIGAPGSVMLAGVTISMLLQLITVPAFGALSDKLGCKIVYIAGSVGVVLVAFPFFWLIGTKQPYLIMLAFFLANSICHAALIGVQPSFYTQLFGAEVRYSGISVGREIASVISGGFAPLIATALLSSYASVSPVSVYLIILAAITIAAVLAAPRLQDDRTSSSQPQTVAL